MLTEKSGESHDNRELRTEFRIEIVAAAVA
jgi:hypothetical protein